MQTTGKKRNTIDKFYTISAVAKQCIYLWQQALDIKETDKVTIFIEEDTKLSLDDLLLMN